MNAAIETGRTTVDAFVAALAAPTAEQKFFSVKMPIEQGEAVEHFWLDNVRYEAGVFHGTLGNDPELVSGYVYGQQMSVPAGQISDWMYVDEGVLVGGYTIRVLRARMSAEEREQLDSEVGFVIQDEAREAG